MSWHTTLHERIDHLIDWWFHFIQRHALPVIALAVLAAAGCAHYTVHHFRINTDTSDMLSEQLSWRQAQVAYERAFPHYSDNIVIVIDSATADEARDAADRLSAHLHTPTDLFKAVYLPQSSKFFRQNGLLYAILLSALTNASGFGNLTTVRRPWVSYLR